MKTTVLRNFAYLNILACLFSFPLNYFSTIYQQINFEQSSLQTYNLIQYTEKAEMAFTIIRDRREQKKICNPLRMSVK